MVDKVPRETLQSWLSQIPLPTFLFKSILPTAPSTSQGIDHTTVLGKQELLEYLSTITPSTEGEDLSIALMGLPNVGKTSVLNSLLPAKAKHHATAPVIALNAASKNPQPTTKLPSESRIEVNGRGIRVIDTPGWDFADDDDEEEEDEDEELDEEQMKKLDELEARMTGDLLRRNLGRVDRIKDVVSLGERSSSSVFLRTEMASDTDFV
jgi:nuclear GTP-binding protein